MNPPSIVAGVLIAFTEDALIAAYAACQLLLLVYSTHRWTVMWRMRRARAAGAPAPPATWPLVTVQLPVYNERRVVERLIDAAAALDYPADRLEIQVLDDSTDETSAIAARAVARHRARGVAIVHVRRGSRDGFKAGALAHGLACTDAGLLAVFDADFVPAPDFLRRVVPHFSDPAIGMVQARWQHLNRDASLLTRAQAVLLDAHFLLEHEARQHRRLFFNFNGTAGVWRRACIEQAGGWTHDTLTEDLDLSYRAQLAGWRFAFVPEVCAPAELPSHIGALESQQRRWARGSIQTARKVLPRVWRSALPARVKLEATLHLTANLSYPALLGLALLLAPVLALPGHWPVAVTWALQTGVIVFGVLPVMVFLAAGQRRARGRWSPVDVLAALVLGVGLSVNNARAVLAGFSRRAGAWERTPKTGEGLPAPVVAAYAAARRRAGHTELLLAGWFVAVGAVAAVHGERAALPFLILLTVAFGWIGATAWRAPAPARI